MDQLLGSTPRGRFDSIVREQLPTVVRDENYRAVKARSRIIQKRSARQINVKWYRVVISHIYAKDIQQVLLFDNYAIRFRQSIDLA